MIIEESQHDYNRRDNSYRGTVNDDGKLDDRSSILTSRHRFYNKKN